MTNRNPNRAVLIYIPAGDTSFDASRLNEFIAQNKFTQTWWNFLPNLYVITSKDSIQNIKKSVYKFVGDKTNFIVVEVDPKKVVGYLKPGGWDAFRKDIVARSGEELD